MAGLLRQQTGRLPALPKAHLWHMHRFAECDRPMTTYFRTHIHEPQVLDIVANKRLKRENEECGATGSARGVKVILKDWCSAPQPQHAQFEDEAQPAGESVVELNSNEVIFVWTSQYVK
eukprot:1295978-Amphidinium_carterae.1